MTGIVAALTATNLSAQELGWLNHDARQVLDDRDLTEAGWLALYPGADRCGCPDSRCIGHHHDEADECGCLPAVLGCSLTAVWCKDTSQSEGIVAALTGFEASA